MSESTELEIDRLNRKAAKLYEQGQYKLALDLAKEAYNAARLHLRETHPFFLASLNNLGELYRLAGDYPAAEPLIHQALEIVRRIPGSEGHPFFIACLNSSAELYRSMGNYAAAEPLFRNALEEDHPATHMFDLRT